MATINNKIILPGEKILYSAKDKRTTYLTPSQKVEIIKPIPIKQLVTKYNMPLKDAFLSNLFIQSVNSLFKETKKSGRVVIDLHNKGTNTPIKTIYQTIYQDIISNGKFPLETDNIMGIFKLVENKYNFRTYSENYNQYNLFYMSDKEAVEFLKRLNKEFLDKDSNLYQIIEEIEKNNLFDEKNEENLFNYIQDIKQVELNNFFNEWFKDVNFNKEIEKLDRFKNEIMYQFIENNDIEMLNFLLKNRVNIIKNNYSWGYASTKNDLLNKIYWKHDSEFIAKGVFNKVKKPRNFFIIEEIYESTFEDVNDTLYTILFNFEKNVKLKLPKYALPFKGIYFKSSEEANEFLNNYIQNEFNFDEVMEYREESLKVDAILSAENNIINMENFKELKEFFNMKKYLEFKTQILTDEEIFGNQEYLKELQISKIGNKFFVNYKKYNDYITKYFALGGKVFDTKKEIQDYIKNNPGELEKFVKYIQLFSKHLNNFPSYSGLSFVPKMKKNGKYYKDEIVGIKRFVKSNLNEKIKAFLEDNIYPLINKELKIEISSTVFLKDELTENDIQEILKKTEIKDNNLLDILKNILIEYSQEKQEIDKMINIILYDKRNYEDIIEDLKDYSKFQILYRYYFKLGNILDDIKQKVMPDVKKEKKEELKQILNDDFFNYIKSFRNGKNVTELEIVQEFYLNRIQFGVALTKQEKQDRLNNLYDVLSFIADYLDIPKHEVGMYGQISVGLAERGIKGSVATFHYYGNEQHIINITKKGSDSFEKMITNFLHEYTHNTDYILSKIINQKLNTFAVKEELFVSENYNAYSKIYELEYIENKIKEFENNNPNYINIRNMNETVEIYDLISEYENHIKIDEKLKLSSKLKEINNSDEKVKLILKVYMELKSNLEKRIKLYKKLKDVLSNIKESVAYQLLKDRSEILDNNSGKKEKYYSTHRELFARIMETILHYDLKKVFGISINPNIESNTVYPIKKEVDQLKPLFDKFIEIGHSIVEINSNEFKELYKQQEQNNFLDVSKYNYKIKTDNLFGGAIDIIDKDTNKVIETVFYENIIDGMDEINQKIQELIKKEFNEIELGEKEK